MTAISPEQEILTSHDVRSRTYTFSIVRDGKRWDVRISDDELAQFGRVAGPQAATAKVRRREMVVRRLHQAMERDPSGTG